LFDLIYVRKIKMKHYQIDFEDIVIWNSLI